MASADVQAVCKVFLDADVFGADAASESVRAMMVAALPHSEGGHTYQQEVLKHCHGLLLETKTLADKDSAALGDEATAAAGRIAEAEQALINASVATQQAQEVVKSTTAQLEDQEKAVVTAKADEASSLKSESKHSQARDKCAAAKASVDSALELLKVDQVEDLQQAFLDVLEQAGAEKPLVDACPAALALPAASRGAFDKLTINVATEVVAEYQALLAEHLAEAEATLRDAHEEALGCEALREVEEEKKEQLALSLQTAVDSAEARQKEEEDAKRVVSSREAERSDFLIRQVLAQDKARKLLEAMAAVERLGNPKPAATEDVDMVQEESVDAKTTCSPSKVDVPMEDVLRHATELGA